jgi:hypothetical protein
MNRLNIIIRTLFISLFLLQPFMAQASVLSMNPSSGRYGVGDSFPVDIKVETEGECINVVQAEIDFSKDLQVVDFLTGESILSIWIDKPSSADIKRINTMNKISFSGGIPGGFCGQVPGDPGTSDIVGRIIFKVKDTPNIEADTANIMFNDKTMVLLNDGAGTTAKLTLKNAQLSLSNESVSSSTAWQEQINQDQTMPEPFVIELRHDVGIFSGKYYINFNTTDKQSGVDRYEVLEIRPDQEVGVAPKTQWWEKMLGKKTIAPQWQVGAIPYLLKDQTLQSIIRVKAIDKAGNERIEDYVPPKNLQQPETKISYTPLIILSSILIIVVLFTIILLVYIFKKIRDQRNEGGKKI